MKPLGILLMVLIAGSACGASSDTATPSPSTSPAPTATTTLQVAATTTTTTITETVDNYLATAPFGHQLPAFTSTHTKRVTFVNLTEISTESLESYFDFAASKMASQKANIFAIIYPLGGFVAPELSIPGVGLRGAQFETVLTSEQIEVATEQLDTFLKKTACRQDGFVIEVRKWMEAGGGSQSQSSLCPQTRVIMFSIDEDRREDLKGLHQVFFHEAYHAFQQDQLNCGPDENPNSMWIIESTATYFAAHLLAEIERRPETLRNDLLERTAFLVGETGTAFEDPGIAEKGAAGLRLMVERGWFDDARILDGSFFHDCARNNEFQDSDPRIQFITDMWHSVVQNFTFSYKALNNPPLDAGATAATAAPTTTAAPATPAQRDIPAAPNDQKIDFINLSNTPTSDLRSWANVASSKMTDQNANILVVVYHIGKNLGPENPDLFAGKPFTPNEVILSQVQIDGLLDQIEQWLRNDECMSNDLHRLDEQLFQYRLWLEGGADSSTQVGLCEQTRFIMMAIRETNPTWDRQRFLVHELYHAFQHDIEGDCNDIIERNGGRGEHTGVVVEGGADYFTFFVADELYTDADRAQYGFDSALNTMLQTAKNMTSEDGSNDVMGSAMATRAAALLRLMVEMGWLEHESIINGSVFHNCARADLNDSNPNYVYARDNWFRIEEQNGEWKFSD